MSDCAGAWGSKDWRERELGRIRNEPGGEQAVGAVPAAEASRRAISEPPAPPDTFDCADERDARPPWSEPLFTGEGCATIVGGAPYLYARIRDTFVTDGYEVRFDLISAGREDSCLRPGWSYGVEVRGDTKIAFEKPSAPKGWRQLLVLLRFRRAPGWREAVEPVRSEVLRMVGVVPAAGVVSPVPPHGDIA